MINKLTKKQKEGLIKKYGKIPSKKEIFEKLQTSQERMINALKGAWENMPEDISSKERDVLIDVIERATKLRKGIYKKILKQKLPIIK